MKILVSPPKFYDVEYEINVWMHKEDKPDKNLAEEQWGGLVDKLISLGVEVVQTPPFEHPDAVFAANSGIAFTEQRIVIPSSFKFPERRVEEKDWENFFRNTLGWSIWHLPEQVFQEGAGDALFIDNTLVTAYGFRSSEESCDLLKSMMQTEKEISQYGCMKVQLVDERFYHLDTCFCPLDDKTALYYPEAFSSESEKALLDRFTMLAVTEEEAVQYACNSIVVGKDVIMPGGCPKIGRLLKALGYTVHFLPMSEFMKAGGACKCLTLRLS